MWSYQTVLSTHGARLDVTFLTIVSIEKLEPQLVSLNSPQYCVTILGGAHCVDMYPYTPNSTDSVEPNDVINTINLIKNETRYYVSLAGPFGGTTSGNTTSSGTTKQGMS